MRTAFTLIELLVVVTIIVVLLSLLTPALDRALYETEMAVCMAQHGGIAKGAATYAMGYRRFYPYRPTMQNEGGQFERVSSGLVQGFVNDDRPALRQFMGIKMLQCPLNEVVDYDTTRTDVWVLPSTLLWFGGRGMVDQTDVRHRPIKKVGDRLGWSGSTHPSALWDENDSNEVKRWRFDYLTSETDWCRNREQVRTAHPDDNGFLQPEVKDHESVFLVVLGVRSRWVSYNADPAGRGRISQNFGRADGSARRLDDLEIHDPDRLVEVPEFEDDGSFPENAEHLPVD
jgi:prepilin-type N-terminal cleavage/methylation domain-containing protein